MKKIFKYKFLRNAFLLLLIGFPMFMQAQNTHVATQWVGTWACAPYAAANNTPPSPYLENNTFRQIVRCSIGGDTLRVKFSNITCSTPVTLNSVNIAVAIEAGGSAIDISTLKQLTFDGKESVTMEPYTEVTSDPIAFPLALGANIAITTYYGQCKTASDMTHHYGSRTDSYILTGDHARSETFEGATAIERWYNIATIDVVAPTSAGAVAVLGNSITDAYGVHGGPKNKWTDFFSQKLLENPSTSAVSVLNLGIGATLVTTSGASRFQQDILNQNGLRWIILFYGVNDIGAGLSADAIIKTFRSMIAQAHAANVRIYGATITPFKGHSYYTEAHEAVREEVNEWIRTSGNFDRVIDFDKIIRDPSDTLKLRAEYSNDWLHPSAAGYKFLGESVNLDLFLGSDTVFEQPHYETQYFEPECATVGANWEIVANAQASNGCYVTVKAGTESKNAAPSGEENFITIPFSVDTTSDFTVYARLNCATADDDSYWVKMDNGDFVMCNGLTTSGWQWMELQNYNLTKGDHRLTIAYREDGAFLDKICISNSMEAPSGKDDKASNACDPKIGDNSIDFFKEGNFRVYPNPAELETNIEFCIDKSTNVSLKIYDLNGKEVAMLVDEKLSAGNYSMAWDASDVGSGNYTCCFVTGSTTICKKILRIN